MTRRHNRSWGQGELYEALCLLTTGVCFWFVGVQSAAFDAMNRFMLNYGLSDVFMLCVLMGAALVGIRVRKSLKLRMIMLERDDAAAQAETIARHDALTGLANRRLFLEAVEKRRVASTYEPASALLLVDLDRFKPVNDIYGHAAGNAVLCAVAERLRKLLPGRGLAARLGGDEFAMIVDCEGGDDLVRLAQDTYNQSNLMSKNSGLREFVLGNAGASAVEFALVMPLLTLLAFAVIEFSLIFFTYNSANHVASAIVRELATNQITSGQASAAAMPLLPSWIRSSATVTPSSSTTDPNTNQFTLTISFPASAASPTHILGWAYASMTLTAKSIAQQEPTS